MQSNARRLIAALLTFLCAIPVGVGLVVASAAPASATSYRYWTYWWGRPDRTSWQYAGLGPAADMPGDGWVLGWRFEITSPTGAGAQNPRTSPSYSDLCSDPIPAADQERVAVVVDYGDAAAAPAGEPVPAGPRTVCVVVPVRSHGSDVMRAASVSLRFQNGFVCGIDGYPLVGCATPVAAAPAPSPDPKPSTSATATPTRSASAMPIPASSVAATSTVLPTTPTPSISASASRSNLVTSTPSTASTQASAKATPTPSASTSASAVVSTSKPPTQTDPPIPALASEAAPVTDSRSALGLFIGLIGVAILAGSAWFTSRRRGGSR